VLVGPSDWSSPLSALLDVGLVFGSIHNNTQITLELKMPDEKSVKRVLISRADVASDHLPLLVRLVDSKVQVSDSSARLSVEIPHTGSTTPLTSNLN
jgi:hypothetical protein